jgi:hypothetical protein
MKETPSFTMLTEGQYDRIEMAVHERMKSYSVERPDDINFKFAISNQEDSEHIMRIGASILCTRWEIGYPGGGFVGAIAENNLMETFSRADAINLKCINFYVSLIYNQGYIA